MRRELNKDNVEYIVVHASNTTIHQDLSLQDILKYRSREGYPDIGFHYVIHREGLLSGGISVDQAGTHTSHFDEKSIGILMVGGKTTRGKSTDNYTDLQKSTLHHLINALRYHYPKAVPIGAGALVGGTSPHFDIGKLNDTSKDNL